MLLDVLLMKKAIQGMKIKTVPLSLEQSGNFIALAGASPPERAREGGSSSFHLEGHETLKKTRTTD